MAKTITMSMRAPTEWRAKIQEWAERHDISMTAAIVMLSTVGMRGMEHIDAAVKKVAEGGEG